MVKETATQKKRRLEKARQKYAEYRLENPPKRPKIMEEGQYQKKLEKDRNRKSAALAIETEQERISRKAKDRVRHATARAIETEEERVSRLAKQKDQTAASLAIETDM